MCTYNYTYTHIYIYIYTVYSRCSLGVGQTAACSRLSLSSSAVKFCLCSLSLQSGLTFVLNEKYMTDAKQEIQGPQLIFMCG